MSGVPPLPRISRSPSAGQIRGIAPAPEHRRALSRVAPRGEHHHHVGLPGEHDHVPDPDRRHRRADRRVALEHHVDRAPADRRRREPRVELSRRGIDVDALPRTAAIAREEGLRRHVDEPPAHANRGGAAGLLHDHQRARPVELDRSARVERLGAAGRIAARILARVRRQEREAEQHARDANHPGPLPHVPLRCCPRRARAY